MNEQMICENNILEYSFKYYLIEPLNNIDKKMYGIKIDKYNKDSRLVDTKCISSIFDSKDKMIKAIRLLNKLQVTPITLEDVVIDNIYSR